METVGIARLSLEGRAGARPVPRRNSALSPLASLAKGGVEETSAASAITAHPSTRC